MRHKMIIGLFILLGFWGNAAFNSAFAASPSGMDEAWGGGAHLGFSPYLGFVGLELQKTNFGLTLGWPASIGLRYYFDPSGTQWFLGTHVLHHERDDDKTKDGIRYTEQKRTLAGMGVGYKWRWRNHWDLTLSVSIAYDKDKLRNSTVSRMDETVSSIPGITFGYAF